MRHIPIVLLSIVISVQLTGCIAIPFPPAGPQLGLEDIETLKPALSSREEVHEALGSPNAAVTDRYEVFELRKKDFDVAIITAIPGIMGILPVGERFYNVLAEYEANGILRELRWEGGWQHPREDPLPNTSWEDPLPDISWSDRIFSGGEVSASPDGRLLATGKHRGIVLRDSRTGAALAEIDDVSGCQPLLTGGRIFEEDRHGSFPAKTAFLSDSKHLVSIARGDILCIWNADTQTRVRELRGGGKVWGLVTARSAPIVAAVSSSGIIRHLNSVRGSQLSEIVPCNLKASCDELKMVLSDKGELLATLQVR